MTRRFRYVSWHSKNQSWQVQRKGFASPGSANTAAGAATLASNAWGIPMSSLLVKKLTKKPKESKYAFVYWHVARRVWYAQAKPAQGGYLGRFESETEAAWALIRRGCAKTLSELRQRKPAVVEPPVEPSAKDKRQSDFLTEETFGQLWAIYRAKSHEPDRLPGDLEDAVSRAPWATSKAATPYVTFWCLLKYGPAREALEVALCAAKGEEGAQPHHVLNVMQDALQRLSQFSFLNSEWKVWTANCGRSVSHHSGPHCAAKALKLIGRAGTSQCSRAKLVKLSGAGAAQALSSGPSVLAQVQRNMEASAELAKVTAPRNLAEWQKECTKVVEVLATLLKQKPTAYRVLWTARTWLKAKMAGAGVRRLSVRRIRLERLLQSWPDSKGHLGRLGEGQRYVHGALRQAWLRRAGRVLHHVVLPVQRPRGAKDLAGEAGVMAT